MASMPSSDRPGGDRPSDRIDQNGNGAGSLAVLESALWRRLEATGRDDEMPAAWLALQCGMIDGVIRAIVRIEEHGRFRTVAALPEHDDAPADLVETARMALDQRRPVARGAQRDDDDPTVAVPVLLDERPVAVVALRVAVVGASQARDELKGVIRQLQWGVVWLREHMRRRQTAAGDVDEARARAALGIVAAVLEQERFATACMAAATELAIRFDCTRVSIGFVRRGHAHVAAISHTARFGRRMNLVRMIGAAMDEAVDQRCAVLFPGALDEAVATTAHARLSHEEHGRTVLTVPMFVVDRFVGAVVFERGKGDSFEQEQMALLDVAVAALGPILDEKRRNDRWLTTKIGESAWRQTVRLIGPGHTGRKIALVALVAVGGFLSLATGTYRINADAEIEGSVRRAVVSAYDGYIQEAAARAGAVVRAGDTLALLEDRDLVLERLRWETERRQRMIEQDRALASRQPATINVLRSQIEQAEAQIRLIDEQIARARLTAPFDGLIVSGDLSQRIGGSVNRGETLFEIAPLDGYRVIMQVDERQIGDVAVGQAGEVVFASLPTESFAIAVDKITPVAASRDGRNLFRVEGTLTAASDRLRPGMNGIAKIAVDERLLVSVWLRPAIDWMRLALWRWMG